MISKITPKGAFLLFFVSFSATIFAQQNNTGRTTERHPENSETRAIQPKLPRTQVELQKPESVATENELVLAQHIVGLTSRLYATENAELKSKLQNAIENQAQGIPYNGNGQFSSLRELHTWVVNNTQLARTFASSLRMMYASVKK